ncbi:MAG TPA: GFA family protein [Chthoniobacterales bacterium]|jgi:hypothetical protein
MNSSKIAGGCLCGAIRYEADGVPYHITHCHCEDCRRSAGAPFVTWASFRLADFRLTRGAMRELAFAGRLRSFCSDCGTSLAFRSSRESDEIDLTVASFDHPEVVVPADHIWVEDRLPWIKLADGLPAHEQIRPAE